MAMVRKGSRVQIPEEARAGGYAVGAERRRSSVGKSARLIIERSAVQVCPPLLKGWNRHTFNKEKPDG